MPQLKPLSLLTAGAVALLGVSVPAAQATPAPTASVVQQIDDPVVHALDSDRMKDNRTWRQLKVDWDWAMPDGIPQANSDDIPQTPLEPVPGYPLAGNALYGPLPQSATPTFQVVLNANGTNIKGRTTGLLCAWTIASPTPVTVGASSCGRTQTVLLPEGTWPLTLAVTDKQSKVTKTVTSSVQVLNVLFAVSGDSYAAGEGYPPFTNPDGTIAWDEPACERSRWSGFVRAAVQAEQADTRSNVTLVDVACSGAEILEQYGNTGVSPTGGMLSPQKKIKQPSQQSAIPGNYLPAQVDQLAAIAGSQKYDVTMFSIGGNDAGLSPIVQSCLLFDTGSVMLNKVIGEFEQDFNDGAPMAPFPGCYTNGQAQIDLSGISNPANLSADCIGTTKPTFLGKFSEILTGCQYVDGYPYKPLYQVADDNLAALKVDTAKLAPCLGATGGAATCQTVKIVNNAPGGSPTAATPVPITSLADVAQAMYPDLTQQGKQGATQMCGVQQDPTKPWGGEIQPDPDNPLDPSLWKLGPNPLQNPLMSPMNQMDNTWVFGHLYEGVAGRPIAVPAPDQAPLPTNVPQPYNPNTPVGQDLTTLLGFLVSGTVDYNMPTSVVPQADGLVAQLQYNAGTYGWQAAMSMYEQSHPYGLCSPDRWVTNLTDYFTGEVVYKGTGTGLHPNNAGYAAYAAMLGPMAIDMANLPVAAPTTTVVPLGSGAPSAIRARLAKKTIKSGKRAAINVSVTGTAGTQPTGRIEIQANKKGTSYWMQRTVRLAASGSGRITLPRKWTKLAKTRKSGNVRLRVRYLGNPVYAAAKAPQLKVMITR